MLVPHLGPLYHMNFALDTYPKQWRNSITIVLRTLEKMDYSAPNTHCPVALINTLGKVLSACIEYDLVHMTKVYRMLPENHFSCFQGRMTTDM